MERSSFTSKIALAADTLENWGAQWEFKDFEC